MNEVNNIASLRKLSQHLNVLYVEDSEEVRESTKDFLLKFFLHVDTAVDGKDGLELYKKYFVHSKKHYDIVISDINMPQLNGVDMCKAIKEINQKQKIIIISAHEDKKYLLDLLNIGVDGFIQKPFSAHKIVEILHKVSITFHFDNIQYFNALIEASVITKLNTDGIITYVNDKFCDITGYTKEELIGQPQSILNHTDDPKSLFEQMNDKTVSNIVTRKRMTRKKKDGSKFIADSTIIPLLNQNGSIKEYMIIRNDITDTIKLKQQIFEKEQEQIIQKKIDKAKESFLLIFTHELKTPLNAIINFTKYIRKQILRPEKINEEKIVGLLDSVLNNSSDMLNNITQILELSKLTSNKLKYTKELFNANKLIKNLIEKFDSLLKVNNIELIFQVKEEISIYCDKYRVEQIISNLISNAIKYGKNKIIISLSSIDDNIKISVEDNGTGVIDKIAIFNLYAQEDEELLKRKKQGTGIGLYFVKLLCNDLSIDYDVKDSDKLSGANFILAFNKRG